VQARALLVDEGRKTARLAAGCALKDIAPTMLALMDIAKPVAMEGRSIILD